MSITQSAVGRVTGVNVAFRDFNAGSAKRLPQRLAVIGQGNTASTYSLDKYTALSADAVGARFGYGSPLHLACRALLPKNNDGIKGIPITLYPMVDFPSTGSAAVGAIGCTGTSASAAGGGTVKIGGIESAKIVIPATTAPDAALGIIKTAIAAVLDMPATGGTVSSGSLPLTSKWKGASANGITIDISGLSCAGLAFTTSVFASGANNPDVDTPLGKIGQVWETMILNLLDYEDTTTLEKFQTFGEGVWDELTKRPCVVASGCVDDYSDRTTVTDARKDDRINFLIESVGSLELPFVIAARGMARIIQTANDNPAQNYTGRLTLYAAGADADQEDAATRDAAAKLGASTNIKTGDVAELCDIVTFYHPEGEDPPAYRYVVDIVKLQNIIYNVRLIFESDDWKGVPLIPTGQPTVNPTAKTPGDAITALRNLADSLALNAIISDADFTKANITSAIDGSNPKRLNTTFPVKLSGNVEVNSTDIYFGFYVES